ncbi:MAG: DNA translocase FtsK 4TM domain-containing protein [Bacteroidales bacterium]|nr:DNA translocase FtsK 4TM domain-containing protein [Bacteroidales bacterium]
MAKNNKTKTDEQRREQKQSYRFVIGLVLVFVGIALTIALFSFFYCGGSDRSIFDKSFVELLTDSDIRVRNVMGKFGAWISDMLITNGVGLMAFVVPFIVVALGLRFIGIKTFSLSKLLWRCFLMTIWGSVALGFVFWGFSDSFYPLIGGAHGYYVAKWLMSGIGVIGTFILLSLLLLSYLSVAVPSVQQRLTRVLQFLTKGRIKLPAIPMKPEEGIDLTSDDDNNNNDENNVETPENQDDGHLEVHIEKTDADTDNTPKQESDVAPVAPIWGPGKGAETDKNGPDDMEITRPQEEDVAETSTRGSLDEPYDPTLDLEHYEYPTLDLLEDHKSADNTEVTDQELNENKDKIIETLNYFGIKIDKIKASVGPTVTLYEIVPAPGIKITKIKSLEDDIALSLAALGIRIIAPIPGKGAIGIEVPNKKPQIVSMLSVIKSNKFQESTYELPVVLGKTISNETFVFDLAKTPHLLVAGATGQGKSVGLNAIITSLLYKKHPSQVKLVLVDPKMVEFSLYSKIEHHFLAKIPSEENAIITDVEKVKATLNSLTVEMDDRYALLMKADERNVKDYNRKFIARKLNPENGHHYMPYIVVVIDEFADLLMTAGKEIEMPIARIAQKARAVGIHMILATQRPSANVITGIIKANFPSRMAFKVSSMVDSRTILDASGAQHLIGRGDMLFSMDGNTTRVQCAFIDTPEVIRINEYIKAQQGYACAFELPEATVGGGSADDPFSGGAGGDAGKLDSLFREVAQMVVTSQQGSTSNIQRRFSLGYNRAGKLMDQLERFGIVGPAEGSKPRAVLVQTEMDLERILQGIGV